MRALSLAVTLALTASAAEAGTYKLVGANSRIGMFYDADTLKRSGDNAMVWIVTAKSEAQMLKERSPKAYLMVRYTFDCRAETDLITSATSFETDGSLVSSDQSYDPRPEAVIPDTLASDLMKLACGTPPVATTVGETPPEVAAKFRSYIRTTKP